MAVSGVEDAMAAIRDTHDNLMSRESLGLAPCLCHRLVCRSVFSLFLYTWYKLLRFTRFTGLRGDHLLYVPSVLEVQQVTLFQEPQSFVEVCGSSCSK